MIAIIDYKAGNLTSVQLACNALDIESQITNDAPAVLSADRVIFPGVGAARACMDNLADLRLVDVVKEVIARGTPFLGICVGTQLILDRSEENGGVGCLGVVPGCARLFRPVDRMTKVPQMGWNSVEFTGEHPVLNGIESGSEFYFVHSYYPAPSDRSYVLGETEYAGVRFASILARDNFIATQFHPERSGRIGLKLLDNFCKWNVEA